LKQTAASESVPTTTPVKGYNQQSSNCCSPTFRGFLQGLRIQTRHDRSLAVRCSEDLSDLVSAIPYVHPVDLGFGDSPRISTSLREECDEGAGRENDKNGDETSDDLRRPAGAPAAN